MKNFKDVILKIFLPHPAITACLVPVSAVMLIYSFTSANPNHIAVYASYFLSAYALTLACIRIPDIINHVKNLRKSNAFLNRYASDLNYRIKISLYINTAINALYAALHLFSGITNGSLWFYSLAFYYALLAAMRFFLLKETAKRNLFTEYLHYRLCGVILLIINLILAVLVFFIVRQNRGFEHHYIVTIAMAAYTFTAVTKSIINIAGSKRHKSPVMSAARAISLAATLISVLSLETSMISAFGDGEDLLFRQIITAATGAAVCIIILAMAIHMIVGSTKEIKLLKISQTKGI